MDQGVRGEDVGGAGRLPQAAAPVSYRDLCKACLWLGLTAYGGPAMVGHVRDVVVERRRWVGAREFADGLALCQLIADPAPHSMRVAGIGGDRQSPQKTYRIRQFGRAPLPHFPLTGVGPHVRKPATLLRCSRGSRSPASGLFL